METTTQVSDREQVRATPGSAPKLIREVRAKTHQESSAEGKINQPLTQTRMNVQTRLEQMRPKRSEDMHQ